jgi:hypothetical protein
VASIGLYKELGQRRNDLLSTPDRSAITTPSGEVSDRLSQASPSARPLIRENETGARRHSEAFVADRLQHPQLGAVEEDRRRCLQWTSACKRTSPTSDVSHLRASWPFFELRRLPKGTTLFRES